MNTITYKSTLSEDISDILGLHDMTEEEQTSFLSRVGELIIESAVLRYVVTLSTADRIAFEAWFEVQQYNESLLKSAFERYVEFAEIMAEEMDNFQSEAKRLFGASR